MTWLFWALLGVAALVTVNALATVSLVGKERAPMPHSTAVMVVLIDAVVVVLLWMAAWEIHA